MIRFLEISNQTLFYYYLVCNLAYLAMLIIALKTTAAHQRQLQSVSLALIRQSPLAPPITILAPAHNEEKSIFVAVRNLLDLDYPELEVIVVNDGSADSTLQMMQQEFGLRLVRAVYIPQVMSAPVRGLYRSDVDTRLLVVDKEPAGSKADAVNAGLNAASSPYVCIVDADSVLERDALLRIMVPVLADPKRVVSVGGIVRVLNGSELEGGRMRRVRLPRKSIEVIQVVEYLRAFLIGREAWARGNMLMIISGAFGVFRTDLVRAVGGYRSGAIGEDFDLVARLHRHLLDKGDLVSALRQAVETLAVGHQVRVEVKVDGQTRRLAAPIEMNLLRIGQEAATNAVRHARARNVILELQYLPEKIRLCVSDDGRGFSRDEATLAGNGHFGLLDMRERAEALGSPLHLVSAPGRGTQIAVEVSSESQPFSNAEFKYMIWPIASASTFAARSLRARMGKSKSLDVLVSSS